MHDSMWLCLVRLLSKFLFVLFPDPIPEMWGLGTKLPTMGESKIN